MKSRVILCLFWVFSTAVVAIPDARLPTWLMEADIALHWWGIQERFGDAHASVYTFPNPHLSIRRNLRFHPQWYPWLSAEARYISLPRISQALSTYSLLPWKVGAGLEHQWLSNGWARLGLGVFYGTDYFWSAQSANSFLISGSNVVSAGGNFYYEFLRRPKYTWWSELRTRMLLSTNSPSHILDRGLEGEIQVGFLRNLAKGWALKCGLGFRAGYVTTSIVQQINWDLLVIVSTNRN